MNLFRIRRPHPPQFFKLFLAVCSLFLLMCQGALAGPGDIVTIAGGGAGDGDQALSVPVNPSGMSYDASGNLFVADCDANRVRKIDPSGVITTVAGVGGSGFYGDGGPATAAALFCPSGVAVDASGNLFISDRFNERIRKVDTAGIITTVAGTGNAGFSGDGGPATAATFYYPNGLAVDASGAIFVADLMNGRIRKISSSGTITTVAGNGVTGFSGDGGSATSASMNSPIDVALDSYGNLYIADQSNRRIRKVDSFGIISTFAGNGAAVYAGDGGSATSASFVSPQGVHVDASEKVFITDTQNNRIRVVSTDGTITTLAGTGTSGFSGDGGAATAAKLYWPFSVTTDGNGAIAIADRGNHRIRKVDASGIIATIAGTGSAFYGEGIAATAAQLSKPTNMSMDASGNIYLVDSKNSRVRRIDPNGVISTAAGTGNNGFSGDGGPAALATFYNPYDVAADSAGNIFISDTINFRIRRVSATGTISTAAGNGTFGFSGDYGPATSASLFYAFNVAVDSAGNLLISDRDNNRIRKVDVSGVITTVAGTGVSGFSGDAGPALAADISSPTAITTDAAGNIYFCDQGNQRIRKIATSGSITTIAGNGIAGSSADGGDALAASIRNPNGIAVDSVGNVYFSDSGNHRVRKVTTDGILTTVAGRSGYGFAGDNGPATSARLNYPAGLFIDAAGNILIADQENNRVRKVNSLHVATGTVIVNDGARATRSQDVALTLSCTIQSGACSKMQLSNDDGVTWSPVETFSTSKAWTLTPGDGTKWVLVKYQDQVGNWSSLQVGTIILDTTPPAINMTSPQDYTSSAPLLTFTISDGSATVKVDGVPVNTVSGGYLDPLPDGTHAVRVDAVDEAGNTSFLEKVFTVDTAPPAVSVSSPAAGTSYVTPPALTYTVSDGTVTVKVDGATVSKVSGSTLDGLSEGSHTVRVESRDLIGNVGFSELQFGIDLPPTVTITSPAAGAFINNSTPILSFSTSNGTVVVTVDGSVVNKVTGDTLGPLADGTHTVRVEATDAAGTGYAERTFSVDATAPVVFLTSPTVSTTDSQPLLSYAVSDGTVTVKVDGVVVSKVSGNRLATLTVGTHTVRVESRDAAGNLGFAEVTFTVIPPVFSSEDFESGTMTNLPWVLSGNGLWAAKSSVKHSGMYAAEAPVSIIDSQSASMEISKLCSAANVSFWFSVSSETNYDFLTFYVDGVQKARWSGSVAWTQVSYPVTAGNHNFKWVYSKDSSVSSGSDTAWVDDIAFPPTPTTPTVTISSPAAGVTNYWTPVLGYAVSDGTVVVKVDGAVVSKVSGNTLGPLADGSHTVRVEATNAVGTGFAETTFTVDTALPALGIDPVSTPTAANSQTITGTRESNASIGVSVNTTATLDAVSYPTSTTWSCAVSGLVEGANTVTVSATDGANNTASSAVTITRDTTAPVIGISAPLAGTSNSRTPVLSYSVSDGTAVVTLDGIVVTKASGDTLGPLADGPHSVRVSAADALGNSDFAQVDFSVDATAPTVTITSPTAGSTNNRTPALAFAISEGTAVVTVDGSEFQLASGDLLGPFSDGPHTVRVAVTDAAGNPAFAEVSFSVDTTAPGVTISSPAVGIGNNNVPVLNFTASDGTVVVKIDGVIATKVSGDALDLLADGLHVVRVEATDSAGNWGFAETAFSIDTVVPVVSITAPVAGSAGSRPELAFTTSDGTVVVKVDGVVVNKVSGDRLDQLATGPHTVRVEATDVAGNVGAAEVSFSVESFTVTLNAGSNGSISGPAVVSYGDTPSYTIVPETGYHITDVALNGTSVGAVGSYSFTSGIAANTTIAASFGIDSFTVTATADLNGTIAGPASVNYGASAAYTLTPAAGYHVTDVLVDGVSVGVVTTYTLVNVTASHTISASFAIDSYAITTAVVSNGTISGPSTVNYGDSATYSITPAVGYRVSNVIVDGVVVGPVTSYTLSNVTAQHLILVFFDVKTFSFQIGRVGPGTISGPYSVTYGGDASFTFTPDAGYHVSDVLVDNVSVGAVTSYSFTNVTADHLVTGKFAIDTFTITTSSTGAGSITGSGVVTYGSNPNYGITPAAGYHVVDVVVDGASVGAVTFYTFSNVTANHTIGASFAINSYSITASAGANGSISGPVTVDHGASASYTITPAVGYHVADLVVDGVSVGAVPSYIFSNVTANHSIGASFAINSYSITASSGANGSISGPASVNYGSSAVYTITPAAGYLVATVLVDGVSAGTVTGYTFNNVTANHTIGVTFAAMSDLTATSVSGPSNANRGSSISVSSTVANQGGGAAGSFTVSFYLSKDTAVTSSDTLLGTKTVTSLNSGATTSVTGSFTVPSGMTTGKYYVGVIVDSGSVIAETNENNNRKAAGSTTNIK